MGIYHDISEISYKFGRINLQQSSGWFRQFGIYIYITLLLFIMYIYIYVCVCIMYIYIYYIIYIIYIYYIYTRYFWHNPGWMGNQETYLCPLGAPSHAVGTRAAECCLLCCHCSSAQDVISGEWLLKIPKTLGSVPPYSHYSHYSH